MSDFCIFWAQDNTTQVFTVAVGIDKALVRDEMKLEKQSSELERFDAEKKIGYNAPETIDTSAPNEKLQNEGGNCLIFCNLQPLKFSIFVLADGQSIGLLKNFDIPPACIRLVLNIFFSHKTWPSAFAC